MKRYWNCVKSPSVLTAFWLFVSQLSLQPGELRAVIGPNGAGKTTFLDVITGKTALTQGDVVFKGRSLVGNREHRIARLGIGRKFQSPRVFEQLTVQENLALAVNIPNSPGPCCSAVSMPSSVIVFSS